MSKRLSRRHFSPSDQQSPSFWVDLIKNGIEGARLKYYRKGQESLFLWPFTDYLMLAHQEPWYATILATEDQGLLKPFSSLSAEDRCFLGIADLESEAAMLRRSPCAFGSVTKTFEIRQGCDLIVAMIPRPGTSAGGKGVKRFWRFIDGDIPGALWQAVNRFNGPAEPVPAPETEDVIESSAREKRTKDRQTYLEPLRPEIGQVFDEIGGPLLEVTTSDFPINLFAVVRQPCAAPRIINPPRGKGRRKSKYDYTASILLTPKQVDWLHNEKMDADTLEEPLGKHSRAIGDTPLSSGVLDFSLPSERENRSWSRDYGPGASGHDKGRSELETWLFEKIVPSARMKYVIFYVPIHIGGLPWLEVFTLSAAGEAREKHYFLYRDVIPQLGTALSTALQAAYATVLVNSFAKNLGRRPDTHDLIDVVNTEWHRAAAWYPYPSLKLSASASGSGSGLPFELPDGSRCFLTAVRGPLPQLIFRMFDEAMLRDRVLQGIKIAIADAKATRSGITTSLAHEFKNFTSPIAVATSTICNRIDQYPDNVAGIPDLEHYSRQARNITLLVNRLAFAFHAEMIGLPQTLKPIANVEEASLVLRAALFLVTSVVRNPNRPVLFEDLPSLEMCLKILSPYLPSLPLQATEGDLFERSASLSLLVGCLSEPVRNIRIVNHVTSDDQPRVTVTVAGEAGDPPTFIIRLSQTQFESSMLENSNIQCKPTNLEPLRWLGGSCHVSITNQRKLEEERYEVTIETIIHLPKVWRP